ncbi:MAG: helix-turn-helix domain-containing protein [Thaumarchaeota archaeon]|nr:helix-turn-helix domain-containing protein [Candidatus Calditenuaceae archaeon]MDW8042496.1 helix-turn-helix domain-containing protein [Nitrososphaerota archaeon]
MSRQPRGARLDRYGGIVERVERYELVEGYGEVVRRGREARFLTRERLAELVGEKASTIKRIENGELRPSMELARRLERALRIKLLIESTDEALEKALKKVPRQGPTLGDMLGEESSPRSGRGPPES